VLQPEELDHRCRTNIVCSRHRWSPQAIARRLDRQARLYDASKRFTFILTEAAVRWQPCEPPVMAVQMGRLISLSETSHGSPGHLTPDPADSHERVVLTGLAHVCGGLFGSRRSRWCRQSGRPGWPSWRWRRHADTRPGSVNASHRARTSLPGGIVMAATLMGGTPDRSAQDTECRQVPMKLPIKLPVQRGPEADILFCLIKPTYALIQLGSSKGFCALTHH
jgi:Domain of unknown function (DUF5753)